jgi:hypothetical protein
MQRQAVGLSSDFHQISPATLRVHHQFDNRLLVEKLQNSVQTSTAAQYQKVA